MEDITQISGTELPFMAVMARAVRRLEAGHSVTLPARRFDPDAVRRAMGLLTRRKSLITEVARQDESTVITAKPIEAIEPRTASVKARIMALQPGQTCVIEGARTSTVRVMASTVQQFTGRRFSVNAISERIARVTELRKDEAGRTKKYPFDKTPIRGQFRVMQGDHKGAVAMQSLARHYARKLDRVFDVRENIDGSISVRCYAVGGLPPKWQIDKEHADLQVQIQAETEKATPLEEDLDLSESW